MLSCYSAIFVNQRYPLKTIGLIGGMSWEGSLLYYQLINSAVKQRLGGLHSAQLLMYSVDFAPIEKLQHIGDWDGATGVLIDAARRLEAGGADFFLIGTNTMHQVADAVSAAVSIPLLHIADTTAEILQADGVATFIATASANITGLKWWCLNCTTDKWCTTSFFRSCARARSSRNHAKSISPSSIACANRTSMG
jgi:hypothetical protein